MAEVQWMWAPWTLDEREDELSTDTASDNEGPETCCKGHQTSQFLKKIKLRRGLQPLR